MKTYKNILKSIACAGLLFASSSCGSNFLDINVDPNNAAKPVPRLLLPVIQTALFSAAGSGQNGFGDPSAVFVHQHNQRTAVDKYNIGPSNISILNGWNNSYTSGIEACNEIIKASEPKKEFAYSGLAKIHKAILLSYLVDMFGDIPYSEANNLSKFSAPKLDKGADVYAAALKLLDEGIADLAKSSNATPASDDLVYGGDMDKWRKAAKSFKLRLYNQVRRVQDVKAQVSALIAEGDLLTNGGDGFSLVYGSSASPDNRHPMYINEYNNVSRSNHISPYFYEIMADTSLVVVNGLSQVSNPIYKGIKDPRIPYYFYNQRRANQPAQNPSEYKLGGMVSIYFDSQGPNRDFDQSNSLTVVGLYPCGGKYDDGSATPVSLGTTSGAGVQRLLPYYSLLFIRAELAQAGVSSENPRTLLAQAIAAAFAEVNAAAAAGGAPAISTAAITAYSNAVLARYDAASPTGKLEHIMTQKWIANYGNSTESYNDVRRTGFPKEFVKTMPGVPVFVLNSGGVFPFSLPYSQTEVNTNPNVKPKLIATTAAKVFWQP